MPHVSTDGPCLYPHFRGGGDDIFGWTSDARPGQAAGEQRPGTTSSTPHARLTMTMKPSNRAMRSSRRPDRSRRKALTFDERQGVGRPRAGRNRSPRPRQWATCSPGMR
jgi:hypothetical protein